MTSDKLDARTKCSSLSLVSVHFVFASPGSRRRGRWPRHEKAGTSYEAPALTHRSGRSYVPKCDWAESFSLAITFCYLLWFVNLYKYRPINLHPCQVQSRAKKPLTSDKLGVRTRYECPSLSLVSDNLSLVSGCWTPLLLDAASRKKIKNK